MGILRNGGYVEHIGMTGMCQQRSYNKSAGFTWDLDGGVGYEKVETGTMQSCDMLRHSTILQLDRSSSSCLKAIVLPTLILCCPA